jgi:hypothetical protein
LGELVGRGLSDAFSKSVVSFSVLRFVLGEVDFVDLLSRLEIGSKDITCAFGGTMGPISTVSIKETPRSQVEVAAIDVGRVTVARIMYEIDPRSN